jgi:hypothetical protein
MKFQTKYRILLWKSYFDKGLNLTNYIKYPIAFFAISSLNVKLTMIIAFVYALLCIPLGYLFYRFGWMKAEIEIQNRYNLFVKQMRRKIK